MEDARQYEYISFVPIKQYTFFGDNDRWAKYDNKYLAII